MELCIFVKNFPKVDSKNKRFLAFLARFFGVYAAMSLLYAGYLRWSVPNGAVLDPFSIWIGEQATSIAGVFNVVVTYLPTVGEPSYTFWVEGSSLARMVEGCNALSVVILFWAFLVAFKGTWSRTIGFGLAGTFVLFIMNSLRIAVLLWALKLYPAQEHLLHGVVFPVIIYGTVFLLWVSWVNYFADYAKEKRA